MKLLCLQLLLFISATSCQGQDKARLPETTIPGRQTKLVKTQGTDHYANIHSALMDKDGNLWFGTTGDGVYRYDGQFFTRFTMKDGLCNNTVYAIAEDKDGNIWFGTDNGACRYDGRTITPVPISTKPYFNAVPYASSGNAASAKNEVWSIMKDRSGKLWLGTREGLFCYNGIVFTRFLDNDNIINKDSLQLKMVDDMLEDRNGTIWLASGMLPGNEGICRYDPVSGLLTSFKPGGEVWIRYLVEDKSGNIWIGCRSKGIWRYDGKAFSRFMEGNDIGLSALADRDGNIWLSGGEKDDGYSSDGNLWLYDGKSLKRFAADNFDHYGVWSMLEDRNGNIWFGTRNNGLYRYDGKTFSRFSE